MRAKSKEKEVKFTSKKENSKRKSLPESGRLAAHLQ
jgi:hypothetical protein